MHAVVTPPAPEPFDKDAALLDAASARLWKMALSGRLPADRAREIDDFETELRLKKQGKIEDKLFAETRLRRGVYGQRYDNGRRHDGKAEREIPFPNPGVTKGPGTAWDAPGMQRIKIPYGALTADQLDVLADLAEEYSDGILHVTTRQDVQLHFVHIENAPALFRRLAAADITTREACGNTVRNVTGCPLSGICRDELFDVSPYADAMFRFLLGHPDAQDFGRKFKVSFSGCADKPCALARMHDLGFIAAKKTEGGVEKRGFSVYAGGGLGAVPYQAQLFSEFVPAEEILPLTQAVCRVFTLHGEKKNRNKARLKFLLAEWGLEKFRDEVLKERAALAPDPRWINSLPDYADDAPAAAPREAFPDGPDDFKLWLAANVLPQRQAGLHAVAVQLPLGDATANQARDLADIARRFSGGELRTSVEQNVVFRGVKTAGLGEIFVALKKTGMAEPGAGAITDVTACPGTDTCKLGVSSSRGLAAVLKERLAARFAALDGEVKRLNVKISGCYNACAQHHLADVGFYGVGRKVNGYLVPHFQLVIGGTTANNAEAYGMPVMALPAKSVPAALDRLIDAYLGGKRAGESFQRYVARQDKTALKELLTELAEVPAHADDPSYYVDFSDVREYSKSDIGAGECAGELVSQADFGLKAAERELFAAKLAFDAGDNASAVAKALEAMFAAAEGLVRNKSPFVSARDEIVAKFRELYCDTGLFHDPFAGGRFAAYFFKALGETRADFDKEQARQRLEEAGLFVEAAHACLARI